MAGICLKKINCKNILLLISTILFAIIVAEIGLRIATSIFYPKLTVSDKALGWKYRHTGKKVWRRFSKDITYDIYINKEGFRDNEFCRDVDVKIMVLGDSMTFGLEANQDKIFCNLLEDKLGKLLHPKTVDVMNFAITGFSTGQQLICLEQYYPKYKPEVVVLMLFEINDFEDNTSIFVAGRYTQHFIIKNGNLVLRNEPSRIYKLLTLLRDKSVIFSLLTCEARRFTKHTTKDRDERILLMIKILERMHEFTETKRRPLFIFYIKEPDSLKIKEFKAIKQLSENKNIFFKVVPLIASERIYGNGHWNEKGHQAVAQLIYEELLKIF